MVESMEKFSDLGFGQAHRSRLQAEYDTTLEEKYAGKNIFIHSTQGVRGGGHVSKGVSRRGRGHVGSPVSK